MAAFDPTLAGVLAGISQLAYEQYKNSLTDRHYNGDIKPPPGYRQTSSIKAREIGRDSKFLNTVHCSGIHGDLAKLESLLVGVHETFWGFTLQPEPGPGAATHNVLAFRGSDTFEEFCEDAAVVQVSVPAPLSGDGSFAASKVHLGFLVSYMFLHTQVKTAVEALDLNLPLCVTGHSLGAALAILAAASLDVDVYRGAGLTGQVQMYNFAGPRVGDPGFVAAYNSRLPASYRVVNLADAAPLYPSTSMFGNAYAHVGLTGSEWSYLHQAGDVASNHSLLTNYIPAVTPPWGPVVINTPRTYPTAGR